MNREESKNVFKAILSILGGLIIGFVTFFGFIFFFICIGLFGWSDGGDEKYLERLEATTKITLVISIVLGLFACIYFIIKMNKPKLKEKASSHPDSPSQ